MKYHRPNTKRGFSLIELLVVIAIVGVLAAVASIMMNSGRAKARDANRIAQMTEIRKALEAYSTEFSEYPITTGGSGPSWRNECGASGSWTGWVIPELITAGYLPALPADPSPCNFDIGYSYASDGRDYKLVSHSKESRNDFQSMIDPALDGGVDPCIIENTTDTSNFSIYSSGATCWIVGGSL